MFPSTKFYLLQQTVFQRRIAIKQSVNRFAALRIAITDHVQQTGKGDFLAIHVGKGLFIQRFTEAMSRIRTRID